LGPGTEHAVILAVSPHDRSAFDIYQLLLSAVAVEIPAEERSKPPGSDELPPADAQVAEALAAAASALDRTPPPALSPAAGRSPGKGSRTWHIVFSLPLLTALAFPLPLFTALSSVPPT
jgi:hypothetical protein